MVLRCMLALACILALGGRGPASAQPAPSCALAALEGEAVAVWNAGVWRAAVVGPLRAGDAKLRTGPDSRALLRCADGVEATIGAASEVNLESLAAAAQPDRSVILQVIEGALGLVAPGPRATGAQLRGPLAIAAARSTEWLILVEPSGATAVFVRVGQVAVRPLRGGGAPALLGPGEGVDAGAEGLGEVVRWGAARIERTGAALGFGWR